MARAAGVSTATVSRVVHAQDRVRPATRQRVLEAIEALGYVPDGAAQSMARQRKEVVGLVTMASRGPDTDIEQEGLLFIDEVLRSVEYMLSQAEWSVLVSVVRGKDSESAYRQLLKISAKVDGLLIIEGIIGSERLAALAARIPVALVAGSFAEPAADVVAADNRSGTHALVRHLIEDHGARRLCYVCGPAEAPDARERRAAFEEAVAGYPGVRQAGLFEGRFAVASGQAAVREFFGETPGELPDAIVCGNDQMAIGVIRELRAVGLRVPADIAVAGFDDIGLAAIFTPALTTVRQPVRLLGERACSRLLERIADPSLPRAAERVPTELVIRESCGCQG